MSSIDSSTTEAYGFSTLHITDDSFLKLNPYTKYKAAGA
jgi:hypothetical protein